LKRTGWWERIKPRPVCSKHCPSVSICSNRIGRRRLLCSSSAYSEQAEKAAMS
jgi:hypothetical protein